MSGEPLHLPVVFFELRGLRCALPVSVVREVLPMPALTPVPLAPAVLRGITPVHGHVLPVLDLGVGLQQTGDTQPGPRQDAESLLFVETIPDTDAPAVQAALAVGPIVRLGTVDEHFSRPPPPRPSFLSATILDATGPALLIDAVRAVDYVRRSISAVTTS